MRLDIGKFGFFVLFISVLSISVIFGQTTTFKATDAVYVKGGYSADSNYVADSLLRVRGMVYDSLKRITYIKFDLSGFTGKVESAVMNITVNRAVAITGGGQNRADVYGVANDNWSQSKITWNTAPVRTNYLYTTNFKQKLSTNPDTVYSLDLTSYVKSEMTGDKIITICLVDTSNNGTDVRLWSGRTAGAGPTLVVSSTPSALVRYRDEIFSSYTLQSDIAFGQTVSKTLLLDLYQGTGDTEKKRPLIIYIHGGGFKGGDKDPTSGAGGCGYLTHFGYGMAKRGYVVASINYRINGTWAGDTQHVEILVKDIQDTKAAIRFFRMNADLYGIDTSRIILVGQSAGSHIALHTAYMDSSEVPSYLDWAKVGGTFEGTSGNPGYPTNVHICIANWGALIDTNYMQKGNMPVYLVHGTADATVPVAYGTVDSPMNYGSECIYKRAQSLKITSGLKLFDGYGHSLDSDDTAQEQAYQITATWLYPVLMQMTDVRHESSTTLARKFTLGQNYPNPFNPTTRINFSVQNSGVVTLKIYNVLGKEVATLVNGNLPAGEHQVMFDAAGMPSGIYFYSLVCGQDIQSKKMLLLK